MSESDHLPDTTEEEMAVEAFVDRLMDIYPNLDREELHETISGCVRDAVEAAGEEESEEDD